MGLKERLDKRTADWFDAQIKAQQEKDLPIGHRSPDGRPISSEAIDELYQKSLKRRS